ncbi:hypothetical protein [Deinococcus multiflagellatus]|uniref:Lipoprotein n=1 Tax=Deinococcus multiflagellatus TaxID=1656887 RepID=A0ABW1ZRY3_9DEIO|nr:hypothetical protein [Deinococcus multiflagellatus]MBZ9715299.1 hypothetical protein [Deinococcus multiflagellatus]
MKKHFHLPLLAALPALLAACGPDEVDTDGYGRRAFKTETECRVAYKRERSRGLTNPCSGERVGSSSRVIYFGPYTSTSSSGTRYLDYTSAGKVSQNGLSVSPTGRVNTYTAPTVSRGGFTTSARASGSVGS